MEDQGIILWNGSALRAPCPFTSDGQHYLMECAGYHFILEKLQQAFTRLHKKSVIKLECLPRNTLLTDQGVALSPLADSDFKAMAPDLVPKSPPTALPSVPKRRKRRRRDTVQPKPVVKEAETMSYGARPAYLIAPKPPMTTQ
jgi:hypothetical protein